MDESTTLYVRAVHSFGGVRIRDRAEAEQHLLRDEWRVGRVASVEERSLQNFVRQKFRELKAAPTPREENHPASTQFHRAIAEIASNLDWLNPYQTTEVEVFDKRSFDQVFRPLNEDYHLFFGLSARRAKVYMNLPTGESADDVTIVRGTCISARRTIRLGEKDPGVYVSVILVSERDKWELRYKAK